jgi:hypothetical protein
MATRAAVQKDGKRPSSAALSKAAKAARESVERHCSQSSEMPSRPGAPAGRNSRISSGVHRGIGGSGVAPWNNERSMSERGRASGGGVTVDSGGNALSMKDVRGWPERSMRKMPQFHLSASSVARNLAVSLEEGRASSRSPIGASAFLARRFLTQRAAPERVETVVFHLRSRPLDASSSQADMSDKTKAASRSAWGLRLASNRR